MATRPPNWFQTMVATSADGVGPHPAAGSFTPVAVEPAPLGYAGLITRAIAFAIDCLIVDGVALVVAAGVALAVTVLPGKQELHAFEVVLGGLVFLLWCVAYWATFWSTTGQSPGARVMHLKVAHPNGEHLHVVAALIRVVATGLAALPLFAGFIPILFTRRRRALNDMLANSVVVRVDVSRPAGDVRASAARQRLAG